MNKAPVNRKHVVGRLLSYVGRGYLALFVVVILVHPGQRRGRRVRLPVPGHPD